VKANLSTKEENRQILLCNTNRNAKYFLETIKHRDNGKYKKIPNFLIKKTGEVINLHNNDVTSFFLPGFKIERGVVVVSLENDGWLKRRTSDGKYVNWLGDIYDSKVSEKKWRGKLFWDQYTDKQIKETSKVVGKICKKYRIPRTSTGHNVFMEDVEYFKGVVSRSNYNEYWTDINPTFNFELI
tara:strand:+ start:369 stop:920 length:552 start_codon:yes stop_codon:yes gene_type:complete